MKLFIIPEVEELTYSYHAHGALAIISPSREDAEIAVMEYSCNDPWRSPRFARPSVTKEEWDRAIVLELVEGQELPSKRIFIFPDAGCC